VIVDGHDAVLLDLDGVLYRGDEPVPHAAESVRALRDRGIRVAFVTNNSSRTPEEVAAKLERLGIAADPEEVATSALATADLLGPRGGTAFVVGGTGVRRALAEAGIAVQDGEPERVDHVVIGLDPGTTYDALRTACVLVQRGARLVATNADPSYPVPGAVWPGAGALLAVVTTTTGAEPEVAGKPFAPLFETARRIAGAERPLVVGDRLDTDVAGAAALGWPTALVLTGVATREDAEGAPVRATFVLDDLRGLLADAPADGHR
jgi:HAD superfamily hydrolase (TIGR01457 family)